MMNFKLLYFEDVFFVSRSVGDPDLLGYEMKIMRMVTTASEIRDKYGDNISALTMSRT